MKKSKNYLWLVLIIIIVGLLSLTVYITNDKSTISPKHVIDWPPAEEIVNEPYSCNDLPRTDFLPPRSANEMKIDGDTFCVRSWSEGAAGHIFTSYTYSVAEGNEQRTYSFVTDFASSCDLFEGAGLVTCEKEKAAFDSDKLFSQYYKSLKTSVNRNENKYTSNEAGFELLLTEHAFVKENSGGQGRSFSFTSDIANYEVVVWNALGSSLDNFIGSSSELASEVSLAGQKAYQFESDAQEPQEGPQGAFDPSIPAVSIITISNDLIYTLYFPGDKVLDETEKEIVDSFRFIELE